MYSGEVRSALRQTALGVTLALLFTAGGVACVALYLRRRRRKDPALLWFGVFLICYGIRIADFLRIVAFLAYPVPPRTWDYLAAILTHLIGVPALLFIREVFPAWRPVLRWVLWAQLPLFLFNTAGDAYYRQPEHFHTFNSVLSVAIFLAFVLAVFSLRQSAVSTRGLRLGLLFFAATVVAENLRNKLGIPFHVEPIGFAVFILTLGDLITHRTLESQQRLMALDSEMDIARQIQSSILPSQLPQAGRISIAARYLPMTAVAGDFYDVLQVSESKIGVLIADVSGHGVAAALIASMVKVAIAAQLAHADDPAAVLSGINQTLCGKLTAQFVTAAYLFLDLEAGTLRYSAAGHPPLLWKQDGPRSDANLQGREVDGSAVAPRSKVTAIEENGLPLGLMTYAVYQYVERPLHAGNRFVLYTDGVAEASNPQGEFFGTGGIERSLDRSSAGTASEYADALLDALRQWVGGKNFTRQEDDLTVVVIEVS